MFENQPAHLVFGLLSIAVVRCLLSQLCGTTVTSHMGASKERSAKQLLRPDQLYIPYTSTEPRIVETGTVTKRSENTEYGALSTIEIAL